MNWYYAKKVSENSIETPYGWVSIPSPSERLFLKTWYAQYRKIHLRPQYPIGKYRVDFACLSIRTAIEIDGSEHYLDPETIIKDRKRQSDLESWGWHVIRIGAWKVFRNAGDCVDEIYELLAERYFQVKSSLKLGIIRENTTSAEPKSSRYHPGDKVHHDKFGEGIILKSEIEQNTEFVEVQFNGKTGKKRLSMDFAHLERIAS